MANREVGAFDDGVLVGCERNWEEAVESFGVVSQEIDGLIG